MEKRALIAIAASFVILLAWSYIFPPPEKAPEPQRPDSAVEVPVEESAPAAVDPYDDPPTAEALELDSEAVAAQVEETVEIQNGPFDAVLTNRGGRLVSWLLADYTAQNGQRLELVGRFAEGDHLPLSVEMDDAVMAEQINHALFETERQTVSGQHGASGERIVFRWSDGRGIEVTKAFTFWRENWLVDVKLDVRDRGRRLPARLAIGPGFAAQEPQDGKSNYYYAGQALWNDSGSVTRRKPRKLAGEASGVRGNLLWAGLSDQYFTALILPGESPAQARWRSIQLTGLPPAGAEEPEEAAEPTDQTIFSVSIAEGGGRLYIGPKKFSQLQDLGDQLEKAVWFATNPFLSAISRYIFQALIWIHDNIAGNYGLAIILATLFLRVLLFPVNQYSMVSMKKTQMQMQRLQPKIKAIKAKYKKSKDAQSRAKMNQETMELYKREGVNPMGGVSGCLPLLAQFPILIGFYNMLTVAVELRGAPFFGWIQDLAQKDPYWILPLAMGVTMFLQQKMSMSKVKDPMQQQQQKFMMFMPVVFTWICLQMPSGMVLYWFVNNVLGIGQQWLVNRHTGRIQAAAQKA